MRPCSFAAAALTDALSEGAALANPSMILLSGGSLASAYASVTSNVAIVVDLDACPASGVQETVRPAKKLVA